MARKPAKPAPSGAMARPAKPQPQLVALQKAAPPEPEPPPGPAPEPEAKAAPEPATEPATGPAGDASEADAPADAAKAASKAKKAKKKKRPLMRLPDTAEELLGLKHWELDRVNWEAALRLGKAKRKRGELLAVEPIDAAAVAKVNGEISWLGGVVHIASERRGQVRGQARRAKGHGPDRNEAIAAAVEHVVSGPLYDRIQREADRIQKQAAKDLAADGSADPPPAAEPEAAAAAAKPQPEPEPEAEAP